MIYLKENGLAESEDITSASLVAYWDVKKLVDTLEIIFNRMLDELTQSEENIFRQIEEVGFTKKCKPKVNKRWGRLGIDFVEDWKPLGLFVGVLLDTDDHKIEPLEPSKGPELMVIIDVSNDEKNNFPNSKKGQEIKTNLREGHDTFDLITHNSMMNKCRFAVLRKPLFDIIYNKYTVDEQCTAIKSEIIKGVNLVIKAFNKSSN